MRALLGRRSPGARGRRTIAARRVADDAAVAGRIGRARTVEHREGRGRRRRRARRQAAPARRRRGAACRRRARGAIRSSARSRRAARSAPRGPCPAASSWSAVRTRVAEGLRRGRRRPRRGRARPRRPRPRRRRPARASTDVVDHRPPAELVEHLRARALHPRALAGGEDDGGERGDARRAGGVGEERRSRSMRGEPSIAAGARRRRGIVGLLHQRPPERAPFDLFPGDRRGVPCAVVVA